MDEKQILELITLGIEVSERVVQLVAELKKQREITDEQLRDYALAKGAEVRARVERFVATVEKAG